MKNQLKPIYEKPKINHQWKNINPNLNHHSPAYFVASEYGPTSVTIAAYGDQWRYENKLRGNQCVSVWVLDERKSRRLRELRRKRGKRGEREREKWGILEVREMQRVEFMGLGWERGEEFEVGFWVWDKREARVWDEFVDLGWERGKEFEGEEICELRDILIKYSVYEIIWYRCFWKMIVWNRKVCSYIKIGKIF